MSDLVGNPKDRFSRIADHIKQAQFRDREDSTFKFEISESKSCHPYKSKRLKSLYVICTFVLQMQLRAVLYGLAELYRMKNE